VKTFTEKTPALATGASIEPKLLSAASATFCAVSSWPMSPSTRATCAEAASTFDFVALREVQITL